MSWYTVDSESQWKVIARAHTPTELRALFLWVFEKNIDSFI
jgi:hypothetical protein